MAVAAGSYVAVVDRDRVALRQGPGCGVAGDSRSDNCHPHSQSPGPLTAKLRRLHAEVWQGAGGGVRVRRSGLMPRNAHEILVRFAASPNRAELSENPIKRDESAIP